MLVFFCCCLILVIIRVGCVGLDRGVWRVFVVFRKGCVLLLVFVFWLSGWSVIVFLGIDYLFLLGDFFLSRVYIFKLENLGFFE